jgi:high-affinity Fe2+/Pb2+ permease
MFNDKTRLYFGLSLIVASIGFFIYGWLERSNGNEFNQIWTLSMLLIFGGMVHLQKIGSGKKKNRRKKE